MWCSNKCFGAVEHGGCLIVKNIDKVNIAKLYPLGFYMY